MLLESGVLIENRGGYPQIDVYDYGYVLVIVIVTTEAQTMFCNRTIFLTLIDFILANPVTR